MSKNPVKTAKPVVGKKTNPAKPTKKVGSVAAGKMAKLDKDDEPILDEEVWTVINSFFEENGLNASQIQSFNDMIYHKIPKAIEHLKHLKIEENGKCYEVEFGEPILHRPEFTEADDTSHTLYPMEATWRNITYGGDVYIDVTITPPTGEATLYEKVFIGTIPVMVKSDLCNVTGISGDREKLAKHSEDIFDHGGYFVIAPKSESTAGGTAQRKVLVPQERSAPNRVFIFSNRKTKPKYKTYAEIRSSSNGIHSTTATVGVTGANQKISCVLPWIDLVEIPLGVVFRALGIEDEKEMALLCLGPEYEQNIAALNILAPTLEYSYECDNQEAALHFIGRRGRKFSKEAEDGEEPLEDDEMIDGPTEDEKEAAKQDAAFKDRGDAVSYATHLLAAEFLPHVGHGKDSLASKAKFLGYMVRKLINVLLGRKPEDRDHVMNKVSVSTGTLLAQQFYGAFRRLTTEIANNTRRALRSGHAVNIKSWIKPNIITNAMHGAISTNAWNTGGSASKGISQIYEQFNFTAGIANMRKLSVPMAAEGGKSIAPRDLHPSHMFVICPAETPEGKNAGLVKNLAMSCLFTVETNPVPVKEAALALLGNKAAENYPESLGWVSVFLNGGIIGETDTPKEFVSAMVNLRRRNQLSSQTSISYFPNTREIHISTEAGRLVRPLFVVENGSLTFKLSLAKKLLNHEMTWTELLATGTVELIDKCEEESANIAGYPSDFDALPEEIKIRYTHCELHPSLMFGIGGSIIPFPDHNQSPRNTYQSAMGKQAIGCPFTNYRQMMSGTFHTLQYLQKPLALSRSASIIGFDEMPAGQNAMVAVLPRPFNEEDSIEINQDSIDRGFMVSYKWFCYYAEISEEKNEKFGIPTEETCLKHRGDASKLTPFGYPKPGTVIRDGDVVIGKMADLKEGEENALTNGKKYVSKSMVYEYMWPSVVDQVQVGTTGDGYEYIRVTVVQKREPVVGDKFAARHGQKGTVGFKPRTVDLPFDKKGIVPDIIMNSLAFPSRMTIAMLIEIWTGQAISSSSPLHEVTLASLGLGADGADAEEQEPSEEETWSGIASDSFKAAFRHPKQTNLIDATPFRKTYSVDIIRAEMARYGMEFGDEYMTDGVTGKPLKSLIYKGLVYYQKLKHMVIDKMHARARGGRTTLTRQPKEGRAAGGGLRIGCMERDCILGQGAARFGRDRLMEQSDEFRQWVCDICGLPAHVEKQGAVKECRVCLSNSVSWVRLPYGAKLVSQEMMAMNIVPRMLTPSHGVVPDSSGDDG